MTLKKILLKGVLYTGISKYSGMIISLVVTAILSRLLSPDDFGIVAVSTVIITFFGIISDMGIAPAIVQHKDLSDNDINKLFSFTFWLSLILSLLFFLSAGLIARYYGSPLLVPICRILSLSLFFNTINIVPNALLYRNKEFKFIAKRTFFVQLISGMIAVVAAVMGSGIFALLINPVLSAIFIFFITFRRFPQKLLMTSGLGALKKIFSYSFYQFLFSLINYFSRNLDKLLIGRYMGMNQLGYYEKSYRLMMLPLQNITHVITPVMHPVLSDYQDDVNYLEYSYLKIVSIMAFIGFPLSVFLSFTAQELMLLIFGMQWESSVPVFEILALTVGIQIVLSTSGPIFQAVGDTKSLFICGLFSAATNVGGLLIGIFIFKTLNAIAWSILITFTINFFQAYFQMYRITFRLPIISFIKVFISPLLLTTLLFIVFVIKGLYLHIEYQLLSLILNTFIYLSFSLIYLQLSKEFKIIEWVKVIYNKIKTT